MAHLADQDSSSINGTAMPDNPNASLPSQVSESIPDDATVVSEDLAVTADGEVKNIETGQTITDEIIVGTDSTPADPLAKTEGESFIPVDASDVKDAVAANGGDANAPSEAENNDDTVDNENIDGAAVTNQSRKPSAMSRRTSHVYAAALGNNQYGAHWGTYNGTAAFFEADGTLFVQQAKGVIDVSAWQGTIDWAKVKAAGVQGAIIRIGYGAGNPIDGQARRNINECKRLGIPFGVYLFSYAENAEIGTAEGRDVVAKLRSLGVKPADLTYPVFYDLEDWTGSWTGHKAPTNPKVWNSAVDNWYAQLKAAGYTNLAVYSYTKYLNTALNTANIHSKTRWVASYGTRTGFSFSSNDRGWQYTSQGKVNGIKGSVDLNAFGVKNVDTRPRLSRLAGTTRYGTMSAVVSHAFSSASTVIVASGENYPDALASSSLAGALNAPIVLTGRNSLEDNAAQQLKRLHPARIIVVGGKKVISGVVANELKQYAASVTRIAGDTRYGTSLSLYESGRSLFGAQFGKTAIVATGGTYADALSVSSYAYAHKAPVLLSNPQTGLSDAQLQALHAGGFKQILVIGGTQAVQESVVARIHSATGNSPIRIQGNTRYDTSVAFARWAIGQHALGMNGVTFATGKNFPDALVSGSGAGRDRAVLLLVDAGRQNAVDYARTYRGKITSAYIVGGTKVISQTTANEIADALNMKHA